ncbi:hypothetical protein LTSEWAN_2754 [Salmonella enterica subsp. enterica serovar Wandsworth str. A4-580]|uniref:Uncharacterized protein n=1 Tax=Salmonella enterica subsp. enterica serovar Wandsworth str. A4-580 TaxID=913086 RepID=G5SC11_SALET|nr:hypothetical protein LTSEWAN_2754 [Salmonella enterica subsp. enterica serovar Wandsworth str. A4-580]
MPMIYYRFAVDVFENINIFFAMWRYRKYIFRYVAVLCK